MAQASRPQGEPAPDPDRSIKASGRGSGGTIWARVMGPPASAGLKEDQGGYVDERAAQAGVEPPRKK